MTFTINKGWVMLFLGAILLGLGPASCQTFNRQMSGFDGYGASGFVVLVLCGALLAVRGCGRLVGEEDDRREAKITADRARREAGQ